MGIAAHVAEKIRGWVKPGSLQKPPLEPPRNEGAYRTLYIPPQEINRQSKIKNYQTARAEMVFVVEGKQVSCIVPEVVILPPGQFYMGNAKYPDEQPIRQITLTRRIAMGKFEVTNEEYRKYLEANGQKVPATVAYPAERMRPVVDISWHDAVKYCQWLSLVTGRSFRLPTEAEWEYAARGAEGRKYPCGDTDPAKDKKLAVFNQRDTSPVDAHPDGASPFGIMDMAGNVWEWVADWYCNKYNKRDTIDPKGAINGDTRVLRGVSWYYSYSDDLRGAFRDFNPPENRNNNIGFRVSEDL